MVATLAGVAAATLEVGRGVLRGYASVLFGDHWMVGVLLVIATLLLPTVGCAGLFGAVAAVVTARWSSLSPHLVPACACNGALVGLSLGAAMMLTPAALLMIAVSGVAVAWLTAVLADLFWRVDRLPALSLPFVIVALIAGFAVRGSTADIWTSAPPAVLLGAPWDGFLVALGSAFFSPYPLAGLLVLVALTITSRYLVFLALAGYVIGHGLLLFWSGAEAEPMVRWGGFNFVLTAMAVGGVFVVPGRPAFLLAAAAVACCALVAASGYRVFLAYGLPSLAMPFLLTTLLTLAALSKRVEEGRLRLALLRPALPELLAEETRLAAARGLGRSGPALAPPFFGEWEVSQGFDGAYTHKEKWRHALDFRVVAGRSAFASTGERVSDFYCFGLPVLAPIAGVVVAVRSDLPDNPPGEADTMHNWGNHVLIRTADGSCVLLAHLQQKSARVAIGDYVVAGQQIAACGSSGRSPEPHLHLHVQAGEALGSPTIPFQLACVLIDNGSGRRFCLAKVPEQRDRVEAPAYDGRLAQAVHLPAGLTLTYRVRDGNQAEWQRREVSAQLSLLGQRYVRTDRGATAAYAATSTLLAFFDRGGAADEFFDIWLLALGVTPYSETVHTWDDAPPARLLPLSLPSTLWLKFRHPLSCASSSRYERSWHGDRGVWRQTGRHVLRVAGVQVTMTTVADLSPSSGCVRLEATLNNKTWVAELIASLRGG